MTEPDQITVQVLKYDGSESRRWTATIARTEGPLIVLDAEFDYDVQHHLLGEIPRGTRTVEYYWLNRWFNVFQFLDSEGGTRLYYCNVSALPKLEGDVLSYVDLDLDLLVQPDLSYQLLDTEEFATNAERWSYSAETRRQASASVVELESMIRERQFPFAQAV